MTDSSENHAGVKMTGADGADGPKAFYILIEARPGTEDEVILHGEMPDSSPA